MWLRNGEHGYGGVTKALHWVTVAAIVAQFVIGYTMDADDSGRGRGRGRGRGAGRGRGRGGEEDLLDQGLGLVTAHIALGLTILMLAVLRVAWRRTGLPPWADTLRPWERRFAHVTERALLALLFVVPLSGLLLVLVDDDWLPLHVAGHIAFFVAVGLHVCLVLKHQLVDRDQLLARMLP